jgi:glycosyltransferase involved in cell wall biosynthesis
MPQPDLSILICAHNPRADYLGRVLDSLRAQTLDRNSWELLLIDNASKTPLAKTYDLSDFPLGRHISEPETGLTPARLRAVREAASDTLLFVDDDNVLEADYLAESLRIGREWPMLGAWGGQQFPEFEGGEPDAQWKRDLWTAKLERDLWSNNYDRKTAPVGAGVCVRKAVAVKYAGLARESGLRLNLDRKGDGLNAAGDIDLAYVACDMGLGLGRFRSLKLAHLIPAKRVSDEYLYKLCEGFGYSDTILAALRGVYPSKLCRFDRMVLFYKRMRRAGKPSLQQAAREEGEARAMQVLDEVRAGKA